MKQGWQIKPLGDVCNFQRGLTYAKSDEVDASDNIVLRATNIDLETNLLDFSELKYINDKVAVPETKKVKAGSLLICTASGSKSHLGKVAYIDEDYGYAFGGFMGMVTPNQELLPKFLFHLMTSPDYKDFIAALSDGANINNLKFDDLKRFAVPLPPLAEQQRIVGILDAAFDGIAQAAASAEQNLQNARALFESHLQSVFTQRGEGWERRPLAEVCAEIFAGGDVPKGNYSKTETDKYRIPIFTNGEKNKGLYGYTYTARVTEPSITISARGTIGYSEIRSESYYPAIRLIVVIPRKEILDLSFLYYAIESIEIGHSGTSIPQLTVPMVKDFSIPIPPLAAQQKIAVQLDALREETQQLESLYQRKLAALDELKKSLLHQAFSGAL